MAPTVDQIAAQHIGQDTPWPSLETATAQGQGTGSACERGYGCTYTGTLSFSNATTPLPMENNPRQLFLRLFGQGDSAGERHFLTAADRQPAGHDRRRSEASCARELGPQDRNTLGDYLDSVREIERRVQMNAQGDMAKLSLPEVPGATSENFDEHLRLMFDLILLAYQGNLTRVQSFMIAPEVSERTYGFIGVPDAFHAMSHHQNDPARKERLSKIQKYHTDVFADFLAKMQKIPDGEGNMLENSMLLFGSNMSNSNAHNQYPLPTRSSAAAAARCAAASTSTSPQRTPLANLHLTLLQRAGVPIEIGGRQHRRDRGDVEHAASGNAPAGGARRCWPWPAQRARRPTSPRSWPTIRTTAPRRCTGRCTTTMWRQVKRLIAAGADVNAAERLRVHAAVRGRGGRQRRGHPPPADAGAKVEAANADGQTRADDHRAHQQCRGRRGCCSSMARRSTSAKPGATRPR